MAASSTARDAGQKLSRYRAMRDFTKTSEPSGREPQAKGAGLSFVIQAHAARRMHHDFRLELGGVLLSWSVPKGPSLHPGERRLAVRTEDHPMGYASFEGIIPAGEYGGGTVVVWDRGTWEPEGDAKAAEAAVAKGRLTFTLHGEKLRGRWHLVRTKLDDGKHESWLLFKGRDEHARDDGDIVADRPESVVTGRTLAQVADAADAVWRSNRGAAGEPGAKASAKAPGASPKAARATRATPKPATAKAAPKSTTAKAAPKSTTAKATPTRTTGAKASPKASSKASSEASPKASSTAAPRRSAKGTSTRAPTRAAKGHAPPASSAPTRAAETTAPPAAPPEDLIALVKSLPVGFGLTSLDKILYREQGVTKAALLAYLAVTAEWMLPHVAGRPLTLVRCPEGAGKQCFFQKHLKPGTPPPVRPIPMPEDDGSTVDYMRVDDMPGLIALAQMGTLEIHTWGCHADKLDRPDLMVFDLDPDPTVGWDRVVEGAFTLRRALEALGLAAYVKTTGGKGLHVVLPVARRLDWDAHEGFTKALVNRLAEADPAAYTTSPLKAKRHGKIFLDYLRNGRGATFIAPYSPRARAGATVAVPVTWEELSAGLDPAAFTVATVPPRLAALVDDPWAGITEGQSVTAAARKVVGA